MSAVEVKNVTKRFGARTIFQDISFSVEDGELVALIGPSGCGKSTLLNMIGTLESIDKGDIWIYEKKLPGINSRKATSLRRNMINYLFQSYALINDMTVYQNLFLSMRFLNIRQKEKDARIHRILQTVGLSRLENAMVNTLSGGEQQRVALARTILKPGRLILADEPTGNLDSKTSADVLGLLKRTSMEFNQTIVMITHNNEIAQLADRIVRIEDGRIAGGGQVRKGGGRS